MLADLLFTASGVVIGSLGTLAIRWWVDEQTAAKVMTTAQTAARLYKQSIAWLAATDENLAVAEANQRRIDALTMGTQAFQVIRPSLRSRFSQWREDRRVEERRDWNAGEVLAMRDGAVVPDAEPLPPLIKVDPKSWGHLDRSGWPKASLPPAPAVAQEAPPANRWAEQVFTIVLPRELVGAR